MDIKKILEEKFKLGINKIELIGEGYDSKAYRINNEYIFKISENNKKSYEKEKAIYDFFYKKLNTKIKTPNIEYWSIEDELSILGYKEIKGIFLTKEIYYAMPKEKQELLKQDIAKFLKEMHNLDYSEISNYAIDNKQNVLEEYSTLKEVIYDDLNNKEKQYIENFMNKLNTTTVFSDKKCLCHNDFSCHHLLLDDEYRLCGIIDFGDSGITDEYSDFVYLLEDSDEEIGYTFGEDILNLYGNINIEKAKEYHDLVEEYYPIETIIYGIRNNKKEFIDKGRREIENRIK